ncbi:MAG: DNA mismatch repair endonuclease MutL [Bacteroidota bacterium]
MPDIIKILPDNVANQIAAGEVIQRPASAVKELLENAIDAGATDIQLIIKDAGKTLIQVVDNGFGMTETDARLCFERHSTSKILSANDLFNLSTFGFRGEALASIAAISHLEMKTKRQLDEIATSILIQGSDVKEHTSCSAPNGTSISIKNLFFNVPARRNFLKADATETGYIIEEFNRVALVNPQISFSFYNNTKLVTRLDKSTLRQRINAIFGTNYGEKLIPVDEKTTVVTISGFIGKPEFARKTRGEQYFFVNNRFIKHPYLHHSIDKAYAEMIPEHTFPSYFIYMTVDPKNIDVNIHPTKTEVKFLDEKTLYGIMKATIRKSFGSFSITPSIDFDIDKALDFGIIDENRQMAMPSVKINPDYNPFQNNTNQKAGGLYNAPKDKNLQNWEKLYNIEHNFSTVDTNSNSIEKTEPQIYDEITGVSFFMFGKKYIITPIKSGLMFIDIANARERIFYERLLKSIENQKPSSQQLLFPQTITLNPSDAESISDLLNEIRLLGFDIASFGQNTFVVNGLPTDAEHQDAKDLVEHLLESFKKNQLDAHYDKKMNLARSLAKNMASKFSRNLSTEEMQSLVGDLFSSAMPETSPSGRKTMFVMALDEIEKKLK